MSFLYSRIQAVFCINIVIDSNVYDIGGFTGNCHFMYLTCINGITIWFDMSDNTLCPL